ncbi:hypothetical protein BSK47_15215 [Paenibacillus odorifer]|uniref:Copper amine oxidase-like N-terminal domain-containing protein n=1 Tax=Paenibacillus odorifer TaxID=189426 RepID=A0AB36JCF1_9BACL|nr:hypothetical protein BSK47_15215 [Paenibacillus odorifer]
MLVCSSLVTGLFIPQVISAAPSPGKLGGIKEIVASPGFWGGSSFAMGENSKYAVLKDGTAVAWGTNMFGQLGISAVDSRPFAISPILKPVTVIVDGQRIDSAQSAIFMDGSVKVPIRDIAESLGYTLSLEGELTLTKAGKKISLPSVESIKVSYTSLVPAAALAKATGLSTEWNSTLYQLTLQTKR